VIVPRSLLLTLAVAAALLAGCGDDSSSGPATQAGGDEQQIRTVFFTYTNALADGDYAKACDQLSEASKEAIARKLDERKEAVRKLTGTDAIPRDCPGQFRLLLGSNLAGAAQAAKTRKQLLEASRKAKIDAVEVRGDMGSIQYTIALDSVTGLPKGTPPKQSRTAVRRENGTWKIDER
jgi:hypothetical protein